MSSTRALTLDDAAALARLLRSNRDYLAPWEPVRDEDYFTVDGQRAVIEAALEQQAQGSMLAHAILDERGEVAGRITLNGIVRGAFQSCNVGYWLAADSCGRGLATAAVRRVVQIAFEELGLHRVQGETLLHNVTSQRVLESNGFVRFGTAPAYLNIAGQWQDHAMYQLLNPAWQPIPTPPPPDLPR